MATIIYNYKYWSCGKTYCPICKITFIGWYCPTCGLPNKTSKYQVNEYGYLQKCDHYHLRPEFLSFENFQLCGKCYTANPSNAKFCRNCAEELMLSQGVDKNAHGWVDLGLSVLWSTEAVEGFYLWNHSANMFNDATDVNDFVNYKKYIDNIDVATQKWGEKWRTPTKEEFEELVSNCKWEKCLVQVPSFRQVSYKHALKAIGPNGNHIIIPVTGHAGCARRQKDEAKYKECSMWTSSEDITNSDRAFAFVFNGYLGDVTRELTTREKKEKELVEMKKIYENTLDVFMAKTRMYLDEELIKAELEKIYARKEIAEMESRFMHNFRYNYDNSYTYYEIYNKACNVELDKVLTRKAEVKCGKPEKKREIEEAEELLRNLGDDSEEKAHNIKIAEEKRRNLWLETPMEEYLFRAIKRRAKDCNGYTIRPVADKKWQGKL